MNKSFTPLVSPTAAAAQPGAAEHKPTDEPQITVKRDGDRVTQITVRCSCGRVIELACQY